jgi:hypothetical protein
MIVHRNHTIVEANDNVVTTTGNKLGAGAIVVTPRNAPDLTKVQYCNKCGKPMEVVPPTGGMTRVGLHCPLKNCPPAPKRRSGSPAPQPPASPPAVMVPCTATRSGNVLTITAILP